jgi:N utilization substance protein A
MSTMKFISLFENMTGALIKDCFLLGDVAVFVVKEGEIGKAVGKKGSNIHKIERVIKKKVRVIEFNPLLLSFIQNVFFPLKVKEIKLESGIVTIIPPDSKTRGYFIGKGAINLRNAEFIVKRYFKELEEIKVV